MLWALMLIADLKILVVEDDVPLAKFLARELERRHFQVDVCGDGQKACAVLKQPDHHLAVLDLNLPGMDGMDLLKEVRSVRPQLPILVLTARNRTEDVVLGLEQGADDFLMKPFSLKELVARIGRLLRRNALLPVEQPSPVGDLSLNREDHSAHRGQRRIDLTPREFAMLDYLMSRAGKVVSRKELMERVWNVPFDPSTNIVDVYLKYLRDKIEVCGEAKLIRTVRGVGYILRQDEQRPN